MAVAVRDVVRYAVTEAAPHELPLLDSLWQLDDEAIGRVVTRSRRRRDPLAFGMNDAVQLVLPVLWVVLTETARQASSMAVAAGWRKLRVLRWFTRRGRVGDSGAPPMLLPPLSRDQIADVRERVRVQSLAASLAPERAEALADAVAVRLALAMDDEAPGGIRPHDERPLPDGPAAEAEIGREGEIEAGDVTTPGAEAGARRARAALPEPRAEQASATGTGACAAADSAAGSEAGVERGAETGADTGVEAGSEPGSEAGAETSAETGAETGADTGVEAGSEPGSEATATRPNSGEESEVSLDTDAIPAESVPADPTTADAPRTDAPPESASAPGRVPEPSPSPESDTTSPSAREP